MKRKLLKLRTESSISSLNPTIRLLQVMDDWNQIRSSFASARGRINKTI